MHFALHKWHCPYGCLSETVIKRFSLTGFFYRFPNLLPFTSVRDLEELTQEVHDFVTMDEEDLPNSVRELAKASEASSRLRHDIV